MLTLVHESFVMDPKNGTVGTALQEDLGKTSTKSPQDQEMQDIQGLYRHYAYKNNFVNNNFS